MITKKFSVHSIIVYDAVEGYLSLRHYDTDIIRIMSDKIIIYTRYKSRTDKKLANKFFRLLHLPFSIYQKNFRWYINMNGSIEPVQEASYVFTYNRPYRHIIQIESDTLELAKKIFSSKA